MVSQSQNPKKSLKAEIISLLSNIGSHFEEDELPDIFEEDPEKLKVYYLLKILDVISDHIVALRERFGTHALFRMIMETVYNSPSNDTLEVLANHFEELLPGNEEEFGTIHFKEYLSDPDVDFWKRFLLLVNLSPRYSEILRGIFGDYGIFSVMALLQSLGEGKVNSIIFREIFGQIDSMKEK
ncbi:MAG: hypothetical protein ABIK73_07140 [candidate division WOR-3 bacterium]